MSMERLHLQRRAKEALESVKEPLDPNAPQAAQQQARVILLLSLILEALTISS
jgi:hypothetical protein